MPIYVIKAYTETNVEYLVDSTMNPNRLFLIMAKLKRNPLIKNCWYEVNYDPQSKTLH